MATDIQNWVNSDWQQARNALAPVADRKKINVYVEGKSDILFWKRILSPHEKRFNIEFDVKLPSFPSNDPKTISQYTGKKSIWNLLAVGNMGVFQIAAVDSDYDYLLEDPHLNSKFVLHTFAYSIENHQCHAENLPEILRLAANDDSPSLNFEEILISYSKIIYESLVWLVFLEKKKRSDKPYDKKDLLEKRKLEKIQLTKLNDSEFPFSGALKDLEKRIAKELTNMDKNNPSAAEEKEALKTNLLSKHLSPPNAYLFARGHTIKNGVIQPMLSTLVRKTQFKQIEKIKQNSSDSSKIAEKIKQYKDSCQDLTTALGNALPHGSCELTKLLNAKVRQYLDELSEHL